MTCWSTKSEASVKSNDEQNLFTKSVADTHFKYIYQTYFIMLGVHYCGRPYLPLARRSGAENKVLETYSLLSIGRSNK